ncbi:acyl-CoA synthetase, partial [Acinetobacter baumannii]
VYVPVNPLFKEEELRYELNDSGATAIVVLDQLADMLMAVKSQTRIRTVFTTSQGEMLPAQPSVPLPAGLDAPARRVAGATELMPAIR